MTWRFDISAILVLVRMCWLRLCVLRIAVAFLFRVSHEQETLILFQTVQSGTRLGAGVVRP